MNVTVRVLQRLVESVRSDLQRPHPFAAERVGFLYARHCRTHDGLVVLGWDYEPVEDGRYVDDPNVGARIDSSAIRRALQRALSSGDCVLHVHAHFGSTTPRFSRVDVDGLASLMPSLFSVSRDATHGGLVLGDRHVRCLVWTSRDAPPISAKMRLVGRPLAILGDHRE